MKLRLLIIVLVLFVAAGFITAAAETACAAGENITLDYFIQHPNYTLTFGTATMEVLQSLLQSGTRWPGTSIKRPVIIKTAFRISSITCLKMTNCLKQKQAGLSRTVNGPITR